VRILYVHRTRGEDAQGIHIRMLCNAFRDLGHEVRLLGPPRSGGSSARAPDSAELRATGPRLFGRRIPGWAYELGVLAYNVPAFCALVAAMIRWRPDFVYERYALFGIAGRVASGLLRVPFVLEVNAPLSLEMNREQRLALRGLAQRLEDWLFRHATRTIVVSGAMARILEARGIPHERLCVMPNGVDRDVFRPDVDGGPRRQELGLGDRFVVGFVGWVRPWHGVDRLVDATAALAVRIPGLVLLIVGDGPAMPDLLARAEAAGIADRVRFTGAVPPADVPGYVAAMDVAVQPDVTEYASPIKLFEYLAMGRPVIAPRRDNITEVVVEGEQALLFEPGDTDGLADCIERAWRDADLRRRLARQAVALVEARGYYWDGNARKVLRLVAP